MSGPYPFPPSAPTVRPQVSSQPVWACASLRVYLSAVLKRQKAHHRMTFLQQLMNKDQTLERLHFVCQDGLSPQPVPYR